MSSSPDKLDKIYELAKLRGKNGKWLLGRKGILEHVPEVTEWTVRKVIQEVRGEGVGGQQAPTPEERVMISREEEQVKLPKIVFNVPPLKAAKEQNSTLKYWVIGSDFHSPYHDEASCQIFYNVIEDLNPEKVILLGDVINLDQFSRYPGEGKYPGCPTWIEEIAVAGSIMANVRQAAPAADLEWYEGNHELRLQKHLMRHDPILYPHIDMSKLFYLSDNESAMNEFSFYTYVQKPEVFNKELGIVFKHGSKVRKHTGMSAQAEVDNLLFSVIMGHAHRLGLYRRSSGRSRYLNQQPLFGMETGCLCKYDLPYVEGATSNWQHGFGVLCIDKSDPKIPIIEPSVVEINNERALFKGKIYKA